MRDLRVFLFFIFSFAGKSVLSFEMFSLRKHTNQDMIKR